MTRKLLNIAAAVAFAATGLATITLATDADAAERGKRGDRGGRIVIQKSAPNVTFNLAARRHNYGARNRCLPAVHARGVAKLRGPGFVTRKIARRKAISNWRNKTASLYGGRFDRWRNARNQNVNCDRNHHRMVCHVVAKPCKTRGFGRFY